MVNIRCFFFASGKLGNIPDTNEMVAAGIQQFGRVAGETQSPLGNVARILGQLGGREDSDKVVTQSQSLVTVGAGLAALPKKLVEKIQANEYIDFNDLPPAKGRSKVLPQMLEGQVILVQSADLVQSRKMIPDLATWVQCYSLYVAVVAVKQPERIPELMAYLSQIVRASTRYKLPAWLVYDQNFRQEAANNPSQLWSKVDPSIYTQCFTDQALTSENWCEQCQGLDHTSAQCPVKPRKRPRSVFQATNLSICWKFNRFNRDCWQGKDCPYKHVCKLCGGRHPATQYGKEKSGSTNPNKQREVA